MPCTAGRGECWDDTSDSMPVCESCKRSVHRSLPTKNSIVVESRTEPNAETAIIKVGTSIEVESYLMLEIEQ